MNDECAKCVKSCKGQSLTDTGFDCPWFTPVKQQFDTTLAGIIAQTEGERK